MRDSDWSREILLRSDWLGPFVAICTTNGEKSPDNLLCRGPNSTSVVRSFCHNQPFLTKELMLFLLSIYQRASI